MTEKEVVQLYRKYKTPVHIIEHCKVVDFVARKITNGYIKKGIDIDYESLHFACLLHDIFKVMDFKLEKKYAKIQKELKLEYPNMDHCQAAYSMLMKIGEPIIAKIVKKHDFKAIIEKENMPFTLEEKIVTYADKRVLHSRIVSLNERFEDGEKRYDQSNNDKDSQNKIYSAYFKLESDFRKQLGELV